jgi:hypothetical protein
MGRLIKNQTGKKQIKIQSPVKYAYKKIQPFSVHFILFFFFFILHLFLLNQALILSWMRLNTSFWGVEILKYQPGYISWYIVHRQAQRSYILGTRGSTHSWHLWDNRPSTSWTSTFYWFSHLPFAIWRYGVIPLLHCIGHCLSVLRCSPWFCNVITGLFIKKTLNVLIFILGSLNRIQVSTG